MSVAMHSTIDCRRPIWCAAVVASAIRRLWGLIKSRAFTTRDVTVTDPTNVENGASFKIHADPTRELSLFSYNPIAPNNVSSHCPRTFHSIACADECCSLHRQASLFTKHTASPEQSGDGQIARAAITGTRAPVPARMAQREGASYCSTVSSITISFLPLSIHRTELVPG